MSGFNGQATTSVANDIITTAAKDVAKTPVMPYHWPTMYTVIGLARKITKDSATTCYSKSLRKVPQYLFYY